MSPACRVHGQIGLDHDWVVGSGSINRGEFKDTKQTGSTTSQGFASGQQPGSPFSNVSNNRYWRTRVPSGGASNDGVTNLFLV